MAGAHVPIDQEYARFKCRELMPWLYEVPSQVLRNGAVSFSVDDALPQPTLQEIAAELASWPEAELRASAVGVDPGVAVPVYASTGMCAGLSDVQQQRLRKKERARKRSQRRTARRAKGSSGRRKAAHRVARCYQYARNVRLEFAHQTSYRLVESAGVRLLVFEALRVKAMLIKSSES